MSTVGINSMYLRKANKKTILSIIRDHRVSRSDIARMTGLTKPAVSAIVDSLIQMGYVEEVSPAQAPSRGRHPRKLVLKQNSYFALGVNIYRDTCIAGVSDMTGRLVKSCHVEIDDFSPANAVKTIYRCFADLQASQGIPTDRILGIGVSVPGPVNTLTGEILNPPNFTRWHNVNVIRLFKRHCDCPVFVENDATAYALDENLFGHGRRFGNYIMLVLADGVGSASILHGEPLRGRHGLNPEIGHVSIDLHGESCICGNRGCLELYTSIPRIVEKARASGLSVDSWNDIVDNALAGDERCRSIVSDEAEYLAFAIENLVNIFAPDAVILSGKIQYKPDLLLASIQKKVDKRFQEKKIFQPEVLMSSLNQDYGTIASTSIVINNFFYGDSEAMAFL